MSERGRNHGEASLEIAKQASKAACDSQLPVFGTLGLRAGPTSDSLASMRWKEVL
jgi:hypothetical protein